MKGRGILIIIAGIIVLLGIAIAVYFVFFSSSAPTLSVGNPFGNTTAPNANTEQQGAAPTPAATQTQAGTQIAPRFFKITDGPVVPQTVAFTVLRQQDASSTGTTTPKVKDVEVRYIDRASGNIYAYDVHGRVLTRLSNKTLPGIQEASWVPDGSMAYVQFLAKGPNSVENVQTYALPATTAGGYFLEQNLAEAQVFASSTLFTLTTNTGGSIGTLARADGTNARTLFSSPLSSILVDLTASNFLAVTKASSGLKGYAFTVNRATGAFNLLLGPLAGLTALPSPSGATALYSFFDSNGSHMGVINTATHGNTPLPLATIVQKCVWSSDNTAIYCAIPRSLSGDLPDDWYQGTTTFSDRFWRIDLSTHLATLIMDPHEIGNVDIDAVGLAVDPANDVLIFTDKHTGSLWAYDL